MNTTIDWAYPRALPRSHRVLFSHSTTANQGERAHLAGEVRRNGGQPDATPAQYDAFLAYNTKDIEAIRAINEFLRNEHVTTFFDQE